MEEKTCLRFIKWTSDMPSKTKMTFMANFGGIAKYGDCSTNWSRKDGRIVYSVFHNFIAPTKEMLLYTRHYNPLLIINHGFYRRIVLFSTYINSM